MIPRTFLNQIVRDIDKIDELKGCMIGFYGNRMCSVLHSGETPSLNYQRVLVIIEEIETSDESTNKNTIMWARTPGGSPANAPDPVIIANKSVYGTELRKMAVTCGLTIVSAAEVVAGGALSVPTGGLAIAVFFAGWVGLAANAVQCGIAIGRITEAYQHPDDSSLKTLDDDSFYQSMSFVLNAVGVVAGLAQLPKSLKDLYAAFKLSAAWRARGVTEASFKALNGKQRRTLLEEMEREIGATGEGVKLLRQAKTDAERLVKAGTFNSAKIKGAKMMKTIGPEVIRRLAFNSTTFAAGSYDLVDSALDAKEWLVSANQNGATNVVVHILDGADSADS